jgi:hypothetical protein
MSNVFNWSSTDIRNNQSNLGMITVSNLCIAGDQRVLTSKGYLTAKKLYDMGEDLELFNGHEKVYASKMKLRDEKVDVYRVTLANGMSLKVNGGHSFPVYIGGGELICKITTELSKGDLIPIQNKVGIFKNTNKYPGAYSQGVLDFKSRKVSDKVWSEYGYESLWEYFNGVFQYARIVYNSFSDYRLHVQDRGQFRFTSYSEDFLKDLQLLLSNLGIRACVSRVSIFNETEFKGGERNYGPQGWQGAPGPPNTLNYTMTVCAADGLKTLLENVPYLRDGIYHEYEEVELDPLYRKTSGSFSSIIDINYIGKEDVYCPTMYSDEYIFVAQGMKTFIHCSVPCS